MQGRDGRAFGGSPMRRLTVATLAWLWAVAPAFADAPIATSNPTQTGPPASAAAPPLAGGEDAAGDDQPIAIGPCGPTRARADGSPDHAAHGAVEVGVGTRGYRHVAATVCKPIGDAGAISVSVGDSQYGDAPRRR
jgi:hypothetical protein